MAVGIVLKNNMLYVWIGKCIPTFVLNEDVILPIAMDMYRYEKHAQDSIADGTKVTIAIMSDKNSDY